MKIFFNFYHKPHERTRTESEIRGMRFFTTGGRVRGELKREEIYHEPNKKSTA
jgi:hypothetical protein